MRPDSAQLQRLLRERFGHHEFRDGQERVVRALLDGRDALAILPTGGGNTDARTSGVDWT
jgi:ATP-dependent DNA helicase RecQ